MAGWGIYLGLKPAPPQRQDPSGVSSPTSGAELSLGNAQQQRDARLRQMAIGTWEDDYQGKRTMILSPDGTGVMVVELSGLKASLFASRLRFDMRWSVQRGRLKKQTVGGEPAGKVGLILKMMGDRVEEQILELSEDRLRLLDQDGRTEYDWRLVR